SRSILEMDPTFTHVEGLIVDSYLREGKVTEARDLFEHIKNIEAPWVLLMRSQIEGQEGKTGEAERTLAKVEKLYNDRALVQSLCIIVHAALGHRDIAMDRLERAYKQHSNLMVRLKVDPGFDPLRSDPRFQELLRRLRLGS